MVLGGGLARQAPAVRIDAEVIRELCFIDIYCKRDNWPRAGAAPRADRQDREESGSRINIAGWLKIDTRKIGKLDGATLPNALRVLNEMAKSPVALVVDEAQHALTSIEGETAMAALKSARDQLNRPGDIQLMLIMSGSDRDKLLRLVNSNGAPFYGSQIQRMPELGQDFITHIAPLIEAQRPLLKPVDSAALFDAFRRPQFFMEALGRLQT